MELSNRRIKGNFRLIVECVYAITYDRTLYLLIYLSSYRN